MNTTDRITGDWIYAPSAQAACSFLTDHGHQALFVGGCVRNDLLGAPITDLDIATDAVPQKVMALAKSAGHRVVPTGIDHGTVTVLIDGVGFEITTFRRDVDTDGRHAKVAFSTEIADDAARRDFTMNALYARADGTIVDPLDGLIDLKSRHVRFINQASDRIREDYLRILRFFRFSTFYGDVAQGFDADALDAIGRHVDGLATLSRERVGSEMIKLLTAPDPAPAIATMRTVGVLSAILPNADDRALGPLIHFETELGLAPDPLRRLAVLGGQDVATAFRLSKAQTTRVTLLRDALGALTKLGELAYRHGKDTAWSIAALRAAMFETPPPPNAAADIDRGAAAQFPITAADLMPDVQGADLGHALRRLETLWIGSDFTLEKPALLADHRSQERR